MCACDTQATVMIVATIKNLFRCKLLRLRTINRKVKYGTF